MATISKNKKQATSIVKRRPKIVQAIPERVPSLGLSPSARTETLDYLFSLPSGAIAKVVKEVSELRSAQAYSKLCHDYLYNKLDKKTLLTLHALQEVPIAELESAQTIRRLQQQGVPAEQLVGILKALAKKGIAAYRKPFRNIEEIMDEVDAARTTLALAQMIDGDSLEAHYEPFARDLEKKFTGTNINLVEELNVLIKAGLGIAGSRDLKGVVSAVLNFFKELWEKKNERDAFVKTVRSCIQEQLNPINIKAVGLSLPFIGSEYVRFMSRPVTIGPDKRKAIFHLIKNMLLTDADNTEFVSLLKKHGLRDYARLHGKIIELQIKLLGETTSILGGDPGTF